jgi:hypothetical protein
MKTDVACGAITRVKGGLSSDIPGRRCPHYSSLIIDLLVSVN